MNKMIKALSGLAIAGLLASAPAAQAVTLTVTNGTFAPQNGYGTSNNDLDVVFSTAGYWSTAKNFSLTSVNQSTGLFNFGSVYLREDDISQSETGSLGVTATFTFSNPFGTSTPLQVTAVGTATPGDVTCSFCGPFDPVDYTLDWSPTFVNFGTNGQFRIDMTDLSFNRNETITQTARLTLLALPSTGGSGNAVPEPTTIALLGLGLLGFAASRKAVKK